MSFPTGSSSISRGGKKPDKSRRSWSQIEEAILIASLKEIVAQGWKADNAFKAGYLNKLEAFMKKHFPTTDLRAYPHINSKVTTWKKSYYSLGGVLSRSGVGFNARGNHKIDCEDEMWDQITSVDSTLKNMRYKSWPYYEDWKEIFGTDRATGEAAEDILDACNELRDEFDTGVGNMGMDYEVSGEDLPQHEGAGDSVAQNPKATQKAASNGKKRKVNDDITGVCDVLVEIGRKTDERLAKLVEILGYESELGKALEASFDQLGIIPELSLEERFEVCAILGTQIDKLKIFKGMSDTARPQYVAWLLRINQK